MTMVMLGLAAGLQAAMVIGAISAARDYIHEGKAGQTFLALALGIVFAWTAVYLVRELMA